MTVIELMSDDALLGKHFQGKSWHPWKICLSALFGLPIDEAAQKVFEKHTGRSTIPASAFGEAFFICGRRSGKSIICALIATFLACFRNYTNILAPGETGVLMCLASDRRQAGVIFGYIRAFLSIPMLKTMVVSSFKESITLSNGVRIEVHTSSYKTVRGFTCVGVICDELAYWSTENSANPDAAVLTALRPSLASTGGLLLGVSSPYGKRGVLWEAYQESYGKNDSDVLVWKSSSREMNSTLSIMAVGKAYARDYAAARAEYGAEFRDDVAKLLPIEKIEACTIAGRTELPYQDGQEYFAFCDPSGGISDSMTLGIAHSKGGKGILDLVREAKPPFSPENVVEDFSATLKNYRVFEITGDRYAGEWPREQFSKRGISYRPSDKTRSELYLDVLAAIMSGSVELLDHSTLKTQLASLDRRTQALGREAIDHAQGGHDDVSNACAGVLGLVAASLSTGTFAVLEFGDRLKRGLIDLATLTRREITPASSMEIVATTSTCPHCGSEKTEQYGSGPRARLHCLVCHKYAGMVEKVPCPKCKANTNVVASGRRCTACGHQFYVPGSEPKPRVVKGARRNVVFPNDTFGNGTFGRFG